MSRVKKDIEEATKIMIEIMKEGLKNIAELEINQIMKNYRNLTKANKVKAIKDIKESGVSEYKNSLLTAMAVVVADAIESARKEVPKASKVKLAEYDEDSLKLGEFDKLPPKVKKRLKGQIDILVQTQKADLDKAIMLQFNSSYESTNDEKLLEYDLYEASDKYIEGPAIPAGSSVVSARGINEARSAFFFEPDVLEEIDAFEFRNDEPETPICQDLNGTIFSADDPGWERYQPPLHFSCDSYIVPILKGKLGDREIERLQPSDKDLEKWIQFHEHNNKCCSGRVGLINIDA